MIKNGCVWQKAGQNGIMYSVIEMKKKILSCFVMLIMSTPVFSYDREEMININVYEKINPAIVSIDTQIKYGLSCGTGCVVSDDGVILTSSHVIEDGDDITVTVYNGKTYKAEVLKKVGRNNDLALLKIKTDKPMQTVKLGDSEQIKVGQKVLAIGNPFGFNGTLTQGIISRIDYTKNKIQTDAAINPGSSGGPLLNTNGEVIGINQSIYNPDNNISNIGIGFAIPVNVVKEFLKSTKLAGG